MYVCQSSMFKQWLLKLFHRPDPHTYKYSTKLQRLSQAIKAKN